MCSHKLKIYNISNGISILSTGSCPSGGTLGAGVKNLSVGIFDVAPTTARYSSAHFQFALMYLIC